MIIPVELGKDRYEIVVERGALSPTQWQNAAEIM